MVFFVLDCAEIPEGVRRISKLMDNLSIFAGTAGFFVGLLLCSRVTRWALSLWVVSKERQRDPAHRSRWRIVATVLLNSGPWILAGFVALTVLVFRSPHVHAWNGFFCGVLVGLLLQGTMIAWFMWRIHNKRKAAGAT
jgi:hypothetical protein